MLQVSLQVNQHFLDGSPTVAPDALSARRPRGALQFGAINHRPYPPHSRRGAAASGDTKHLNAHGGKKKHTAGVAANEGRLCVCAFYTGPVCTCNCVCVCARGRQCSVSAAGSTQAAAEGEREGGRIKEEKRLHTRKERLREVPAAAPSVAPPSSRRVKAPIERKQGHLDWCEARRARVLVRDLRRPARVQQQPRLEAGGLV